MTSLIDWNERYTLWILGGKMCLECGGDSIGRLWETKEIFPVDLYCFEHWIPRKEDEGAFTTKDGVLLPTKRFLQEYGN